MTDVFSALIHSESAVWWAPFFVVRTDINPAVFFSLFALVSFPVKLYDESNKYLFLEGISCLFLPRLI